MQILRGESSHKALILYYNKQLEIIKKISRQDKCILYLFFININIKNIIIKKLILEKLNYNYFIYLEVN